MAICLPQPEAYENYYIVNMELEELTEISSGSIKSLGKVARSCCKRRKIHNPSASPSPLSSASEMISRGE